MLSAIPTLTALHHRQFKGNLESFSGADRLYIVNDLPKIYHCETKANYCEINRHSIAAITLIGIHLLAFS